MTEIEKNKILIERYPFLLPRNIWTGKVVDNYDYSYVTGMDSLPEGWRNMFLCMCEDMRTELIKENRLEKYMFSDIKEKFGVMRCYDFELLENVRNIIDNYEYISQFVCSVCGSTNARECDDGWTCPYCDECFKKKHKKYTDSDIKKCIRGDFFTPNRKTTVFKNFKQCEMEFDVSNEWKKINYMNSQIEKT